MVAAIALCAFTDAGIREPLWNQVATALSRGLPRTALQSIDSLITSAERDRAYAEAVKAITLRVALEARIEGNHPEEKVRRMQASIARAPGPERPLLEAILAHWTWEYFQVNRWRILQRTRTAEPVGDDITTWDLPRIYAEIDTHYLRALADTALLRHTPIGDYAALLDEGNAPDACRPTLYDFVAREALAFYSSGEQSGAHPADAFELGADSPALADAAEFMRWRLVTPDSTSPVVRAIRLHQELLRFHAGDADPSAFIDADLWRLDFARNVAVGEEKSARLKAVLARLADRWENHELSARAIHERAQIVYDEGDLAEARRIALIGLGRYPNSVGGRRCFNLIQGVEARSLQVWTESPWRRTGASIELRYRNLSAVHFRIVRSDFLGRMHDPRHGRDRDDGVATLLAATPVRAWSVALPPTPDYRERTFTTPAPPGLASGCYALLSSADPGFGRDDNDIAVAELWVSDLALLLRAGGGRTTALPFGATEGFVLDAVTGMPLAGATVRTWLDQPRQKGPTVRTSPDGLFRVPAPNPLAAVYVTWGNQSLGREQRFYGSGWREDRTFARTFLFTDRSTYRPGQTIRYKGLCIEADQIHDRYQVLGGRQVTVRLLDVNDREMERASHRTNDYGSFSGSFTAPSGTLLGNMTLRVEGALAGQTFIRVEEYKRPKFELALDPPAGAVRLGGPVRVPGRATAYTGAPMDGARVVWRVTRDTYFAPWWRWRYGGWRPDPGQETARGETVTDGDGRFVIAFDAAADPRVAREEEPTFAFSVHVDVIEPAGETRSCLRIVRVGYATLAATLSAPAWLDARRPVELTAAIETLNGVPCGATGTLRIHRLRQPDETAPRHGALWDGGGPAWSGGDGRDRFSADVAAWPIDGTVLERRVVIDSSGRAVVPVRLEAGLYRARFETRDSLGDAVTAECPLQVLVPDADRCVLRLPDVFVARSSEVEVGDDFVAVWGSGYRRVRAYIEVEHRGRLLQAFWTAPERTQIAIRQHVDPSMRGNFMVRVTMVHDDRAYLHEMVVRVPWSDHRLTLGWSHFTSKLVPGGRETWAAVVSGPDATRTAAEMVATLYDASLDVYGIHRFPYVWPFRTDYATRRTMCAWGSEYLRHAAGSWHTEWRDGSLSYRTLPSELLRGVYPFGVRTGSVKTMGSIEVSGQKRIDTGSSQTRQSLAPGRLRGLPVDNLRQAVAPEAGIAQGGELHFRGGRSGEVGTAFDGASRGELELSSGPPGIPVELSDVVPRRNLEETAFFFPHLLTDPTGTVRMEFIVPEALTRWRFIGFAHDRNLRVGTLEAGAVTDRDLMVQPNPPRFLREGDVIEFTARVVNRSRAAISARVRLTLADTRTGAARDSAFDNCAPERTVEVPAGGSRTCAWRLRVPDGPGAVTYTAVAAAGAVSDGEEGALTVLPRGVLVTESLPLPIRGPAERHFEFDHLAHADRSTSLRHVGLTVQMVSNPAWYAVMALPYLIEYPYACSEQTFNRLYANALARHIANHDPRIRRIFDLWRGTATLDSPLEKNQELKSVLIEETPWVRQARDAARARRNVGVLFDANRLDHEETANLDRLGRIQLPDGAWPWFPGGQADDYITLYITTGFGRLRHLGVNVPMMLPHRSLMRLDGWMDVRYRSIEDRGDRERNHLDPTIALYLYGRSFFISDRPVVAAHQEALDYWLDQGRRHWLTLARQSQAQLALALTRFGDAETARDIMRSIGEHAVHDDEFGMYWRDEERSWWWWRAPIETQAVMIEAFDEVTGDSAAVEDCSVWLLKQKQTRDWRTSKATADAVYALLLRGADRLVSDARVEVSLGGRAIRPAAAEAGTGFYEERIDGAAVRPDMAEVTVRKTDPGVAWGAVHWQYLEDMKKVPVYEGTPLRLRRTILVRSAGPRGPELHPVRGPVRVGDELVIRIELRTDRDMAYVHLKDYRGSGVEPLHALSGYRYQGGLRYYEETRDVASHFFIDYLPKGVYVFEVPVRVQLRGRYQAGMAQIQCMYAPEFNGHSEGMTLDVN